MRIALLCTCMLVAACGVIGGGAEDGGGGPTRTYSVSAFSGLTVAGPYDVVVAQGSSHSVRAEGDPAVLDRLTVRVDDGELWIGARREGFSNAGGSRKTVIYVTAPKLESVTVGGSGDIRIARAESPSFEGTVGGSGDLQIDALATRDAEFKIAGSGDLKVGGKAERALFKIGGSGDIKAAGLQTRTASISIAGSGSVTAHATESANVSITGSGDVVVSGTDRCTINKLGSGDVKCHAAASDKKA